MCCSAVLHRRSGESIPENPLDLSFTRGAVENIYFFVCVFLTIAKSKTGHFEGGVGDTIVFTRTWVAGRSEFKPTTQVKSPRLVTHTCDPTTGSPAYLLSFGPQEAWSQNTRCVVFLRMTHKVDSGSPT